MKKITVFTPTYNRADLLTRCYQSMCNQTSKDFLWMVIDDGSTDHTRDLVQEWMATNQEIEIEYYYKENGGLHTAYNEAIAHLQTPLSVCIDSDDWMPDDAIEKFLGYGKKKDLIRSLELLDLIIHQMVMLLVTICQIKEPLISLIF